MMSLRKKQVLVIDDSGVLLRSMKETLGDLYTVRLSKSGQRALNEALEDPPDLILLDYDMPGWDGKKTFEEFKSHEATKDIPIIFLTGVMEKKQILNVLSLNPQGYMLKPVKRNKLIEMIDEVLRQNR